MQLGLWALAEVGLEGVEAWAKSGCQDSLGGKRAGSGDKGWVCVWSGCGQEVQHSPYQRPLEGGERETVAGLRWSRPVRILDAI